MQFTLKTLAISVLILALGVATLAATYRSRQLEWKLNNLRDSHGMVTVDSDGDRWEAVPIGSFTFRQDDTFLLRVRNFEKYKLEIHFFDGVTSEYKHAEHLFVANETAVRLVPEHDVVYVHDTTWPIDNQTMFKIAATDRFFVIHNHGASGDVSEDPIRAFVMLTSDKQPRGAGSHDLFRSRRSIEETCRKYELNCVWFTITPK